MRETVITYHALTVWALPFSLAATGGIVIYFLFLQVLRCFTSLRASLEPMYSVTSNEP